MIKSGTVVFKISFLSYASFESDQVKLCTNLLQFICATLHKNSFLVPVTDSYSSTKNHTDFLCTHHFYDKVCV